MAKKNGNNKQGIVSWATSVIALLIGLSNPLMRVSEAWGRPKGQKWVYLRDAMTQDYTGFYIQDNSFEAKRMIRGYAPIVAAITFKKATGYLAKTAKIKSLIPRLGL